VSHAADQRVGTVPERKAKAKGQRPELKENNVLMSISWTFSHQLERKRTGLHRYKIGDECVGETWFERISRRRGCRFPRSQSEANDQLCERDRPCKAS
jgi:hypothetical protein